MYLNPRSDKHVNKNQSADNGCCWEQCKSINSELGFSFLHLLMYLTIFIYHQPEPTGLLHIHIYIYIHTEPTGILHIHIYKYIYTEPTGPLHIHIYKYIFTEPTGILHITQNQQVYSIYHFKWNQPYLSRGSNL